jgi:hypothetical protein
MDNIPPTGRDARASTSPGAHPAEDPLERCTGTEAPARPQRVPRWRPTVVPAGEPPETRRPRGNIPQRTPRRRPPGEVPWNRGARAASARTPLDAPPDTRRPREPTPHRLRPQRPPRGPDQKSEGVGAIPAPRPSPKRALVGNRALCGREHICCKPHTISRPPIHLGANEGGVAGGPTKVGPRIYEGGGERETGPRKGATPRHPPPRKKAL